MTIKLRYTTGVVHKTVYVSTNHLKNQGSSQKTVQVVVKIWH